jgi:Glutaredoxin-like domain (DUF836)
MTTLVQILSVPDCTLCDTTSHALRHLRFEYPGIRVERLNMADWPELLQRYGLLSCEYDVLGTHAVIIEERLAGTGHPSEDTLRRWLDGALIDEGIFDRGIRTVDTPED